MKKKTQRIRSDVVKKPKAPPKKKVVRKSKVIKTMNEGTFTPNMFFNWLRQMFRRKSMYWKPISATKNAAKIPYIGPNKRRKFSYVCNRCKGEFDSKQVNVHHKIPCGTMTSFEDISQFVKNLFVEKDLLELLCTDCHNKEHSKK